MSLLDELGLTADYSIWKPTCQYCDFLGNRDFSNIMKWHIIKHSETVSVIFTAIIFFHF